MMLFLATLGFAVCISAVAAPIVYALAALGAKHDEPEPEGLFYPGHFALRDGELLVTDAYLTHVLTAPDARHVEVGS